MPAKPEGVYRDSRGGWYLKVTLGNDPLTGKRVQITKRGYRTAAEAGRDRRELLGKVDAGLVRPSSKRVTVNEMLDLYLDGIDADGRLAAKTRFDYRHDADDYVRPLLGARNVRDVTPEVILAWQRKLLESGGVKTGGPLAPNTVRLARAPLAGAMKLALATGVIVVAGSWTSGGATWPKPSTPGCGNASSLHRKAAKALKREGPLRDAFNALAGPERDRIRAELPETEKKLAEL